jgi:hypothetical protein
MRSPPPKIETLVCATCARGEAVAAGLDIDDAPSPPVY